MEQVEPAANDLVAWLNVQIDTDERLAKAAAADSRDDSQDGTRWDAGSDLGEAVHVRDTNNAVAVGPWGYFDWDVRQHIACWDPARVLAEAESKRAILRRWKELRAEAAHWQAAGDEDCRLAARSAEQAVGSLVRALAVAYRHRDGWREEWAA